MVDILKFILKKTDISQPIRQNLKNIYCNEITVFAIIFILVGKWGPSMKIGIQREIININIKFSKHK